jgi:hypothetical protein
MVKIDIKIKYDKYLKIERVTLFNLLITEWDLLPYYASRFSRVLPWLLLVIYRYI